MANIKSIGGNPIVLGMDGLNEDVKHTLLGNRPSATLDGTLVTADDAAPTTPVDTTVYGQSTQNGTPTPSAPVPIVSVEGDASGNISLVARGRNLVNMAETYPNSRTQDGITLTVNADGSITANGTAATAVWSHTTPNAPSMLLPAGTYTTYAVLPDGTVPNGYCPRVGDRSSGTAITYSRGVNSFVLDKPTLVYVVLVALAGTTASNESVRVMLEVGSTATAYQPYLETVTPIDLDGHELRSLPDGTRDELIVDAEGHVTLVQRVQLTTQAVTDGVTGTVGVDVMSSTGEIANGATVLYALATPVTHDLGTVPLVPLVGPDLTAQTVPTAPLALTYERDATIVLDRLTAMWASVAPVEGDTASANYSVGSYLMHGGQLCKVTTAIATGETINIGTNVTATTVMAEVIALTQ